MTTISIESACREYPESRLHYALASDTDIDRLDVAAVLNALDAARSRAEAAEEERDDLQRTFDLRWDADMRAVRRWQAEATGRALTWPDRADMVVWLLEKLDAAEARAATAYRVCTPFVAAADNYADRAEEEYVDCDATFTVADLREVRAAVNGWPSLRNPSDADLPTHEDVRGLLREEYCPLCGEGDDELCSHGFHAPAPELRCHDCGLPYKDWRFADFVVSDNVWAQIGPTGGEGGILCVNCMVGRCRQEGLVDPQAGFTSGPFVDDGKPAHPAIWRERALAAEADAARLREALGGLMKQRELNPARLLSALHLWDEARAALSHEAKTTEGE